MSGVELKRLFGGVVISVAIWLWLYNQEKDQRHWPLLGVRNYVMTTLIGLVWFLLGVAVFTVPYLQKCGVALHRAVGSATMISTLFSAIAAVLLMLSGRVNRTIEQSYWFFKPTFIFNCYYSQRIGWISGR